MRFLTILRIDWWLIIPVVVLLILGLTTLSSISPIFFRGQLISIGIALLAFFIFSQMDVLVIKSLSLPIYIGSILLLVTLLIIGEVSRGAVRWVYIFGIPIQFSEIFKPLLTISLASYLTSLEKVTFRKFIFLIVLALPLVVLIALQPDLGSALIYAGVVGFTMLIFGFPIIWFGLSLLPALIISPFFWKMLHDYQQQRILTFIHPANDPLGTSYNSVQAIIAVGSGMILGKGFSESTQSGLRFLPERHTDFIFATLSEGLGFLGSFLVILVFSILLYRIYSIFRSLDEPFGKIVASAFFSLILIQFFLNIGMNIGIVPIVGVTLPFVSYGGSSLLSNFIMLGILSSLSSSIKRGEVLEIK